MSRSVSVVFEVRSMAIMEDTLKAMNIDYNKSNKGNVFTIKRDYNNIVINGNTNKIRSDEMDKSTVNEICKNYTVNWYKDRAIREGNEIREEVKANGEVHLHVLN
jgi:hypothetical protein